MATPRHERCAALLAEGVEPEAAMVAAGWPAAFAGAMAARVIPWLIGAGVLPQDFAYCPAPEPEAWTSEAPIEPVPPAPEPPDFPEIPVQPDASASDAPSADAAPASAEPTSPTTDGNAPAPAGETRPAKRPRRNRT